MVFADRWTRDSAPFHQVPSSAQTAGYQECSLPLLPYKPRLPMQRSRRMGSLTGLPSHHINQKHARVVRVNPLLLILILLNFKSKLPQGQLQAATRNASSLPAANQGRVNDTQPFTAAPYMGLSRSFKHKLNEFKNTSAADQVLKKNTAASIPFHPAHTANHTALLRHTAKQALPVLSML